MRRSSSPWVVAGGAVGEVGHCQRCGRGLSLPMPIDLNVLCGALEGFTKTHRHCKAGEYREPEIMRQNWAASRDTGVSSWTIYSVLGGVPFPHQAMDAPHDGADFGRCHRLLALFPEWRAELPRVAERCPAFGPLVAHWDELTALYEEELPSGRAPKLYDRIQQLRNPKTQHTP